MSHAMAFETRNAEPRFLMPSAAVLSMLVEADDRGPEIGARRGFVRAAAAAAVSERRMPVPLRLLATYDDWVKTTIASRHGRASDVHLGLRAFVLAHGLGLPSTRTRASFFALAYGADDAVACMAEAGLLWRPTPARRWGASISPAFQKRALLCWLEECLAAFDARVALGAAARPADWLTAASWWRRSSLAGPPLAGPLGAALFCAPGRSVRDPLRS